MEQQHFCVTAPRSYRIVGYAVLVLCSCFFPELRPFSAGIRRPLFFAENDGCARLIIRRIESNIFLEAPPGIEPGNKGFADLCLTAWLWCRKKWSGLRGSNSLPPPWQGGALPDELNPHNPWCLRSESNQRHGDFQSPALPTELQRRKRKWRPGWGSNPRPLA